MSMSNNINDSFDYRKQCFTCNSSEEIIRFIHESFRAGVPYRAISKETYTRFDTNISEDAIANHLKNHTKLSEPDTKSTLLGVVKPPTKEWTPRVELEGDNGEVTTPAISGPKLTDFSQILEEMGVDSEIFEVEGYPKISRWQTFYGEWLTAYKLRICKKASKADLDSLIKIIQDVKPSKDLRGTGDYAFVFAAGDLQLGKSDGDGTEGIIKRYRESLQKAVNKVMVLQKYIGPILISWVGDCIEGMVSQGGKNARRTELTTTQQVKLLRLLMTETIKAFAPLTKNLTVVSVPGNHDQAQREPVTTDPSDSWAVDALVAVSEALEFNPEAFGHVRCLVVPFDEMTTTVTIAGTTIAHAHGHQWQRGKHWQWWSGQHWGGHDIGEADILLCGHLHSGAYEQQNFKYMIRTPSFEKESTYWRHKTGMVGNPSAVTFLTKDKKLKFIDFE